jgi:hypothetical protein
MRRNTNLSLPLAALLLLTFAGVTSAAERSLKSIHHAWLSRWPSLRSGFGAASTKASSSSFDKIN